MHIHTLTYASETTTTTRCLCSRVPLFACHLSVDPSEQPVTGAALRRKQRRLRSWWRHEQQSIAAALATSLHHTPRGQRRARAGQEESELHYTDKDWKTPPPQPVLFKLFDEEPGGGRPEAFAEPRPQERVLRHTAELIGDVAPVVPALGVPEPQTVDQLVAVLKPVDSPVPDQIIAVPKISWPSRFFSARGPCRHADGGTAGGVPTDVVVLMETDTEDEEEEEEEERLTWIDDNDDAWALIRPPRRHPFWQNLLRGYSQWHPAVGASARPGRDINTGRRGGAMLRSTVDTHSASVSFMDEFPLFLPEWVDSGSCGRFSLLLRPLPRGSAPARLNDCGSGMSFPGFAGFSHLELCSRRLPGGRHAHAEKCADASGELFSGNFGSSRHIAPGGALDDEEFFVVEGSGVAGSPGVSTPR